MDKNYTVVETSRLAAVRGGAHIWSVVTDTDIENGSFGYIGNIAEDVAGHETYEFGTFDADTLGKKRVVLVADPEWSYDECRRSNQALFNYINAAGVPFRAFDLIEGDKFALSAPGFVAIEGTDIAKGQYVILAEGSTKAKIVATEAETEGAPFVGVIEDVMKRGLGWTAKNGTTYGRPSLMYLVRVLKNAVTA